MPVTGYVYSLRKIGGLWFLRLGQWQFSFCRCRQHPTVNMLGMPDSSLDDCFAPASRGLDL